MPMGNSGAYSRSKHFIKSASKRKARIKRNIVAKGKMPKPMGMAPAGKGSERNYLRTRSRFGYSADPLEQVGRRGLGLKKGLKGEIMDWKQRSRRRRKNR